MRVGQKSVINLLLRLFMTVVGFAGNLYFARKLGSSILGAYFLTLTLVVWLSIGGNLGIRRAITKRISDSTSANEYFSAGLLIQSVAFTSVAISIFLFRTQLNDYVGRRIGYVLIGILFVNLAWSYFSAVLDGFDLVHFSSALQSIDWTTRILVQIGLVFFGLGFSGLLYGYITGGLVAIAIGVYWSPVHFRIPLRSHFEDLFQFSKYSWVGELKRQAFVSLDTLVLGFFVGNSAIGIYEIAVNIASTFSIFGESISKSVFPELSKQVNENSIDAAKGYLEDSLRYSGLFLIPGLLGAAAVGKEILSIYGPEFVEGYRVLLVLIVARLCFTYMNQFLNVFSAIDRPDIDFQMSSSFVLLNLVLNISLVYYIGWVGAAIATAISSVIVLSFSHIWLSRLVDIEFPVRSLGEQSAASIGMFAFVSSAKSLLGSSLPIVILLVVLGAGIYVGMLYSISPHFRKVIQDNSPSIPSLANP